MLEKAVAYERLQSLPRRRPRRTTGFVVVDAPQFLPRRSAERVKHQASWLHDFTVFVPRLTFCASSGRKITVRSLWL
jgi:hypothetical protein